MTVVLLLLIAHILLVLVFIISKLRQWRPYPPGPTGLPVIGNMMMMDQLTHRGLANLARRYGGLFHLKMGFVHMMVVSSPDMARPVLQAKDSVFSNRPATVAITYLTYDRADMVFAHYGPFWRQTRKLCVMRLFSRKRVESWQAVRDEVASIVRVFAAHSGSPVNVGEHLFKLTKNVIYRAAFGCSSCEKQDEFIAIILEFSKLFGAFNIADFIPFLGWLDLNGLNARLAKARSALDHFIDQIIDQHLQKKKDFNRHAKEQDELHENMVDDLLNFYSEEASNVNESEDLHKSVQLTRNNVKAIIMDIMFGGTETIASAVEWAMTELIQSPEDMKRVQQELAEVVGISRRVEESDLEKLPFFRCCIKETLRLHPPIPLLLHEASEDAMIGGYRIPKQSRVIVNVWAIGRDSNSWPDAETFNPGRFLGDDTPDFKGYDFQFIPFGSGRRSCPGMGLGLYGLEMCVAHLLHCFTWKLPDGVEPSELCTEDVFGLTAPRATRLVAVPTSRLLYPVNN